MNFETIIGLEIHVELKTNSKIYSPSKVSYGAPQNTNTNIIDWGFPGVLPRLNRGAYDLGIMLAAALHATVNKDVHFDRKHYFYPDNPKGFQITQRETPLAVDGYVEIPQENGGIKKVGIEELHIEEDAGKNTHADDGNSYVDLNRQGTTLIEIVSRSDMRTSEEAYNYLESIKQIIQFTGASDVKMEEGSMRVDTNVSIRPYGQDHFNTKTELKNLNSFNHVKLGLEYEIERQVRDFMVGKKNLPETRRFDEASGKTVVMRVKEGKDDYRFFPEPDIPPMHFSDEEIAKIQSKLPESAANRKERYVNDLGITDYDANVLTASKEMADFFEATADSNVNPKLIANWLMGEISAYLNAKQVGISQTKLTPKHLEEMIALIEEGTISSKIAKKVFAQIIENDTDPRIWVEENNLAQISDSAILEPIVGEILDENEQSIIDFHNGKDRAVGFLVGQIMKQTRGKANPKKVNEILMNELNKR